MYCLYHFLYLIFDCTNPRDCFVTVGDCSICDSGQYQDAKGALSCNPCPSDTYYEKKDDDDGATALR